MASAYSGAGGRWRADGMNTTRFLRHLNARRCLRLLMDGRALSRADMARELGLTRSTVGYAINALDEAGFILNGEGVLAEGRTGRPGITLSLRPDGACFIGLNIGLRQLSAVALDLCGTMIASRATPVTGNVRDPDQVFAEILTLCRRLIADTAMDDDRIEGIGVAVPGLVDHAGMIVNAPFLQWRDVCLREQLYRVFPQAWQIQVWNDALAFGYMDIRAESTTGSAPASTLYVLMNEGIGSALFVGGQPLPGAHGHAGEIGRMLIASGENVGMFESLAGFTSFASLLPACCAPGEGVAHLLAEKHRVPVARALNAWSCALAVGLANAIHLLDPAHIVLGGPVALLYPEVETGLRQQLQATLMPGFRIPPITVARQGEDGAAIGAAAGIRQSLFALPDLERESPTKELSV